MPRDHSDREYRQEQRAYRDDRKGDREDQRSLRRGGQQREEAGPEDVMKAIAAGPYAQVLLGNKPEPSQVTQFSLDFSEYAHAWTTKVTVHRVSV